ncbi:DUF6221 family protein [Nonomuraea sp. MTCD27]|uniref:DUF6221 family protein n=1 Tax=Nonomuraea sp. MTCD27 TaxID=1676747 RepID=UPI0035BED925
MDLVDFIRARLDEDEQAAAHEPSGRRIHPADLQWEYQPDGDPDVPGGDVIARDHRIVMDLPQVVAAHIARHDPARVLREVEAKRRLLQAHLGYYGPGEDEGWPVPTPTLLALPYADHKDYREDWRP